MASPVAKKRLNLGQNKSSKIAFIVLETLENNINPMKPEELVSELGLNLRSIRYGLKVLIEENLIDKYPDLGDLRSFYYYPVNQVGN
jgi:predicted transcriptional regulator